MSVFVLYMHKGKQIRRNPGSAICELCVTTTPMECPVSRPITARINRQSQLQIGIDCVEALVLQLVCTYLVGESDSATFVAADIHQHTLSGQRKPVF